MDHDVIQTLERAGIAADVEQSMVRIAIQLDEGDSAVPVEDDVVVATNERSAVVTLGRADELFSGHGVPPDFSRGPSREFVWHFWMIERTAAEYCAVTRDRIRDEEFAGIYNHLRRRPDGSHAHPLFSYLRAAARLLMSLRDVSPTEYEAVLRRLTQSARTFADGPTSTNYTERVLADLL